MIFRSNLFLEFYIVVEIPVEKRSIITHYVEQSELINPYEENDDFLKKSRRILRVKKIHSCY